MGSRKKWPSILEEQERVRLKREEWLIQQKLERKHEERKLKMIEEYERKRAESIEIDGKQKSLRQSKSISPQRRETSSPDYEHSKDRRQRASVTVNGPEGIFIDKRNLHKIKINIYQGNSLPTKNQSTSRKIERDIINPDDIILPRRQNEGACPMFNKNEITETEEIRTVTFSQDEQLEKPSTSRKNVSTCRRSPGNDIIQHRSDSSSDKSTTRRDVRSDDDDDRYNRDRCPEDSIRHSKEKNKSRYERSKSSSHYSRSPPRIRNQSRSRYRSRSHSPISQRARERRVNNDRSKYSPRRNYPAQSRELDNRASSFTNSSSNNFHNPYIRSPDHGPMLMSIPRVQAPPMFMPVFPGVFPPPFPPMNMYRWQQPPPRFSRGRGNGIRHNR